LQVGERAGAAGNLAVQASGDAGADRFHGALGLAHRRGQAAGGAGAPVAQRAEPGLGVAGERGGGPPVDGIGCEAGPGDAGAAFGFGPVRKQACGFGPLLSPKRLLEIRGHPQTV